MGEAKRRKAADDPGGARPGRAEDFRAGDGKVAVTIDIAGHDPVSAIFEADQITDILALVDSQLALQPTRPGYYQIVQAVAADFVLAMEKGNSDGGAAGIGFLWTALNHPQYGERMRAAVSRELRNKNRAHITWSLSEAGLGIALAAGFIDLAPVMSEAPRDALVVASVDRDDGKPN